MLFERTFTDCERVSVAITPLTTKVRGNLTVASAAAQDGGH